MAKGKQNAMVCRSHIILYYGNRETIRYGKAARQSTCRYKPFFFSQNFEVFITESHEGLFFWERVMVLAGKKTKDLSRKMPVDGMWQAKVHQIHHLYRSILAGVKKTYLRNQ